MSLQVLDCSCMQLVLFTAQLGSSASGMVGVLVLLWVTAEITALLPFSKLSVAHKADTCSSSDHSKLYPCLTSAYGVCIMPEAALLCCR